MTKIMLVEDDNNLREIYEARLLAEGYEIIGAKDGEEALAMAVKERPDLIISDVMMPKISGFDMLDILRSTPETKDTKVIMMTALSQAEDKARADKLGADRYLVKSQVTLEDVAKVAREVLSGEEDTPTPAAVPELPVDATAPPLAASPPVIDPPAPAPAPIPDPIATPLPAPTSDPMPVFENATPTASATPDPTPLVVTDPAATVPTVPEPVIDPQTLAASVADEFSTVKTEIEQFAAQTTPAPEAVEPVVEPPVEVPPEPVPDVPESADAVAVEPLPPIEPPKDTNEALADAVNKIEQNDAETSQSTDTTEPNDNVPVAHKKVIAPLSDLAQQAPDLDVLLAKEDAKDALAAADADPVPITSVGPPPTASADMDLPIETHQAGDTVHPAPPEGDPANLAL